jgi:hypothetical protein
MHSLGAQVFNAFPSLRSELTKDEMQAQLASRARILFWGSIVLGTLSVCLVGHAIYRYQSWTDILRYFAKFLSWSIKLCHFFLLFELWWLVINYLEISCWAISVFAVLCTDNFSFCSSMYWQFEAYNVAGAGRESNYGERLGRHNRCLRMLKMLFGKITLVMMMMMM